MGLGTRGIGRRAVVELGDKRRKLNSSGLIPDAQLPALNPDPPSPARLGIVADDLTGAMDTGVQFAKEGLHTVVMLGSGELPPAEMVVISTDSRDEPAEEARRRARDAAERLRDRTVYKKIDSTLRGNLGPELEGMLEGLGLKRALVAPAFPANGRTTVDGYHRVNGVLLSESGFAQDPTWPATESHIPTLLAKQTHLSVGLLRLSVIERGDEAVRQALQSAPSCIIVADVVTPDHLRTLASALALMEERWLPCGSAGLAGEWPRALGMKGAGAGFRWSEDRRPVLVLAGSRNRSTAGQLQRAAEEGSMELLRLSAVGDETGVVDRAAELLSQGRSVGLTTTFSEYREGMGVATAERLADIANGLLARCQIAGLFMTGGDIARAVCRGLGATALRALGEVQAGVAAGLLVGGPHDGVRVVTKAGGFGDDRAIIQSIDCLQGRLR